MATGRQDLTTRRRAQIRNQVLGQFEAEYRRLTPPPRQEDFRDRAQERARARIPFWGRPWSVWFLVLASVAISGLRAASLFVALANTHNAPLTQLLEGLCAVAMTELGIVLTGFRAQQLRREHRHKPRHVASLKDLVRGVKVRLGLASPLTWAEKPEPSAIPMLHNTLFAVALVANVWVTAQTALANVPGAAQMDLATFTLSLLAQPVLALLPLLVALTVGAAAPVAAKAAGEAAARDMFRGRVAAEQVEVSYEQALSDWQEGLRRAWETEGSARLEAELTAQQTRLRHAPAETVTEVTPGPSPSGDGQRRPFATAR